MKYCGISQLHEFSCFQPISSFHTISYRWHNFSRLQHSLCSYGRGKNGFIKQQVTQWRSDAKATDRNCLKTARRLTTVTWQKLTVAYINVITRTVGLLYFPTTGGFTGTSKERHFVIMLQSQRNIFTAWIWLCQPISQWRHAVNLSRHLHKDAVSFSLVCLRASPRFRLFAPIQNIKYESGLEKYYLH
jgi:hypothetical protein